MKWTGTNKYYRTCGQYKISKAFVNGQPRYTAWDGKTRLGTKDTQAEAEALFEEENAKNSAVG